MSEEEHEGATSRWCLTLSLSRVAFAESGRFSARPHSLSCRDYKCIGQQTLSVHHAVREHRASVEHRAGVRRPPTPTLPQQTPFLDKQIFPTHKNDRAAAACFKGVEARSRTTRRVAGHKRTIVTAFGAVTALVTAALIVAVALIRALAAAAVGYTCTCVKITGRR